MLPRRRKPSFLFAAGRCSAWPLDSRLRETTGGLRSAGRLRRKSSPRRETFTFRSRRTDRLDNPPRLRANASPRAARAMMIHAKARSRQEERSRGGAEARRDYMDRGTSPCRALEQGQTGAGSQHLRVFASSRDHPRKRPILGWSANAAARLTPTARRDGYSGKSAPSAASRRPSISASRSRNLAVTAS